MKTCSSRLPVPRPGQVLGLVGTNGIGKSTALKVLAGKLKPNLGRFNVICLVVNCSFLKCFAMSSTSFNLLNVLLQNPPDWQEILTYFRGSELQNYFTRILEDNLKVPNFLPLLPGRCFYQFNWLCWCAVCLLSHTIEMMNCCY